MSSSDSDSGSNPTATITNKLGYAVDIYDVFNPSTDPDAQGLLTYTKLANLPSGATAQPVQAIHAASQLQAMRTGNIPALNSDYYQQFPVAVMAVSNFADSLDFTLTSDMQQGMEDSFKFIKYTSANPESQLAKDFRKALSDDKDQASAVDTYFQGSGSFKQCTFSTWVAVFSWQAQFTNPWQGTYYLYSMGSSGTPPALVATLAIVASAQASSAVLTMSSNNQTTPVVMVGNGTMQEQNPGSGGISVALTPTWLNIAQTSGPDGQTVIKYVIGAAFTGTISGTNVVGDLNQLPVTTAADKAKNAQETADQEAANFFSVDSFEGLVGMLVGIGMLYYMYKGHKEAQMERERKAQKDAKSKSEAEERKAEIDADYQEKEMPRVRRTAQETEAKVPEVTRGYANVGRAAEIQAKFGKVIEQGKALMSSLKGKAPSKATNDAATNLNKARAKLRSSADPNTTDEIRSENLGEVDTMVKDTATQLETASHAPGPSTPEKTAQADAAKKLTEVRQRNEAAKQNQERQRQENERPKSERVDPKKFEKPRAEPPRPRFGTI